MAWWSVSFECGEVDFNDLPDWEQERIMKLVMDGYTNGELCDYALCSACMECWDEDELNEDGICPNCCGAHEDEEEPDKVTA